VRPPALLRPLVPWRLVDRLAPGRLAVWPLALWPLALCRPAPLWRLDRLELFARLGLELRALVP